MNNYIKWFKRSAIGAAAVLGCAACTDSWDEHYDQASSTATTTMWEEISKNPKLTQFAQIISRVHVSKSETETTASTYKDLLNSGSTFTVWAPEDGTYNADSIMALLDAGENYRVEQNFLTNHMARYNYPASGVVNDEVAMYNSKVSNFAGNGNGYALKGVALDMANSNIGVKNGTLHSIQGITSYRPNLYEYIFIANGLDSLANFIKSNETVEFSESGSIQGPTVNGKPTYVDSMFYTNNLVLNSLGARIMSEDSLYAMVMPTNTAWRNALARTEPLLQYRNSYVQSVVSTNESGQEVTTPVTTNVNGDSLKNIQSHLVIIQSGIFNTRWQHGYQVGDYTNASKVDSLDTTNGLRLYNNDPIKGMNDASAPFDNKTPVGVSNGYAFVVDNWGFRLNKVVEPNLMSTIFDVETYTQCSSVTSSVSSSERNPAVTGEIPTSDGVISSRNYSYYTTYTPSSSAANPTVTLRMRNVLSGTYDIYAIVIPENFTNSRLTNVLPNRFRGTMTYYDDLTKATTATSTSMVTGNYLRDESVITSGATTLSGNIDPIDSLGAPSTTAYSTSKVDSVLLFRDFKFPVCYLGLNDAYVTMRLQSVIRTSETKQYSRTMRIAGILLVGKDE